MDLKELRKFLGLTQKEFAQKLRLSQGQISAIEQGQRTITDRLIMQIALCFNLSEEWLRTGEGEPYNEIHFQDSFLNELVHTYKNMSDDDKKLFKEFLVRFGIIQQEDSSQKNIVG